MTTTHNTQGKLRAKQSNLMHANGRHRMAANITACGASIGVLDEIAVANNNARRLAACWNACEGVSTEILETAGTRHDWADIMQELENERVTLLEHLQSCVTGWQKGDDVAGPMRAAMALLAQHQTNATRIRADIDRGARQSNGKLPG